MASIQSRDGVHRVQIRRNGIDISRSFRQEDDAKAFAYYKERLIDNMKNFDVPLKDRLTLETVIQMKTASLGNPNSRRLSDYNAAFTAASQYLDISKFLPELSYDDWLEAANKMLKMYVYRGTKAEYNKRLVSVFTVRRYFAVLSSCISYAISKGIALENHPLKVTNTLIQPIILAKGKEEEEE